MKKVFISTMIFILAFSTLISAATIADISSNHWAYQSVNSLVDKGLLELYEDGTFRGNDNVSRYQLAIIVARILEEVESGSSSISGQDMELLRKLSVEFQEELVDLAITGQAFAEQIKSIEQKNLIQDEFMTELKDVDISTLKNDITKLSERISHAESDVTSIIDSVLKMKEIEERITAIEKVNQEQSILLEENQKQIEELSKLGIEATNDTIQSLNDRISINATRLNSLQDQMRTMKTELEAKDVKIEELEVENSNYKTYLYGVAAVSLALLLLGN